MANPLHIALVAVGSHGDVHPFVGLGLRLKTRGHRVTLLANDYFEPLIRGVGLQFLTIGSVQEYLDITSETDLWRPRTALAVIARCIAPVIARTYEQIDRLKAIEGNSLILVGSSLALGARIAQEKLAIPMASAHLAPLVFRTLHEMPRYSAIKIPRWTPRFMKRAFYWLADMKIDQLLAAPVNDFRRTLGLAPLKRIFKTWLHSPQMVLALFPEFFGAIQPDWPPNTHAVGFPLFDEATPDGLPAQLELFLNSGTPPIAFTPGSAMFHGHSFFDASADACRRIGRRGLLLSRHREHIPPNLPTGVIHVDYAPFSQLLPRCAALVHHGGIGTTAQGLAAGVPQLIQPFAHDQFDNATRLHRLGVGRMVWPKHYQTHRVARELQTLINSPDVAAHCAAASARMRDMDALGRASELVESLKSGA